MRFTFYAAEIPAVPGMWAMEEMLFTEATQYPSLRGAKPLYNTKEENSDTES